MTFSSSPFRCCSSILAICLGAFLLFSSAHAFVVRSSFQAPLSASKLLTSTSSSTFSSHRGSYEVTRLHLAKRKRRRKDSDDGSSSSDLPDFELKEDYELDEDNEKTSTKKTAGKAKNASSGPSPIDAAAITPAMMGTRNAPVKSVRDLITDRSLEKKLEFDDEENMVVDPSGTPIPDLVQLARSRQQKQQPAAAAAASVDDTSSATADKRARQAARRAELAAQAQQQEEEGESILAKLPMITNEEGKVEPLKLLETGTWLGIFALVAWEFYLNSPLFERAAPMAPVVYSFFL